MPRLEVNFVMRIGDTSYAIEASGWPEEKHPSDWQDSNFVSLSHIGGSRSEFRRYSQRSNPWCSTIHSSIAWAMEWAKRDYDDMQAEKAFKKQQESEAWQKEYAAIFAPKSFPWPNPPIKEILNATP